MNAANGIHTMAYRVVDICTIPITSVHGAAFPRFFKKGVGGVQNTIPYALQVLERIAPLALVACVAMAFVAPLIPHLVGKSFHESVVALRWLCLLPVFCSFHLSSGGALTGRGAESSRQASRRGRHVNFAVNFYLIPNYGWHGAAWSSLATDGGLAAAKWSVLLAVQAGARHRSLVEERI